MAMGKQNVMIVVSQMNDQDRRALESHLRASGHAIAVHRPTGTVVEHKPKGERSTRKQRRKGGERSAEKRKGADRSTQQRARRGAQLRTSRAHAVRIWKIEDVQNGAALLTVHDHARHVVVTNEAGVTVWKGRTMWEKGGSSARCRSRARGRSTAACSP
jgi:hypothetical protein